MIKNIFINPIERRLRAGWRIFLFIIIIVGIAKLLGFTIDNLFGGMPEDKTLKFFFIILIAAIASTWILKWFIRHRSIKNLLVWYYKQYTNI